MSGPHAFDNREVFRKCMYLLLSHEGVDTCIGYARGGGAHGRWGGGRRKAAARGDRNEFLRIDRSQAFVGPDDRNPRRHADLNRKRRIDAGLLPEPFGVGDLFRRGGAKPVSRGDVVRRSRQAHVANPRRIRRGSGRRACRCGTRSRPQALQSSQRRAHRSQIVRRCAGNSAEQRSQEVRSEANGSMRHARQFIATSFPKARKRRIVRRFRMKRRTITAESSRSMSPPSRVRRREARSRKRGRKALRPDGDASRHHRKDNLGHLVRWRGR